MKNKIRKAVLDIYYRVKKFVVKRRAESIPEYIERVRPKEEEYKKWLESNLLPLPSTEQAE